MRFGKEWVPDVEPAKFVDRADVVLEPHLWAGGNSVAWANRQTVSRLIELNGDRFVRDRLARRMADVSAADAFRIAMSSSSVSGYSFRVLACLAEWRCSTIEQMAAITGCSPVRLRSAAEWLWLAGLVRRGRVLGAFDFRGTFPDLWRLDRKLTCDWLQGVVPLPTVLHMSGGIDLTVGSAGDRHNLFACELGLRIAERVESSSMVFGERMSSAERMVGLERDKVSPKRAADVTMVRSDGLKVMFELGLVRNGGDKRAAWWIEFLSRHGSEFVVVFVDALKAGERGGTPIETHVRRMLKASELLPSEKKRVLERIGFVRWSDWFDGPHRQTPAFDDLVCRFATTGDVDTFDERAVATPFETPYAGRGCDWAGRCSNMFAVPWWLRVRFDPVDPFSRIDD